jgi:hypothetical protein
MSPQTASEFWDTHCSDCGHDLHPMNVCSAIVGGDQNGPDYCPCALDYPGLAAAYNRGSTLVLDALEAAVRGLPQATGMTSGPPPDGHLLTRAAVLEAIQQQRSKP